MDGAFGYWYLRANIKGAVSVHHESSGGWRGIKEWGQADGWGQCFEFPFLLSHCWLGDRKGIWLIKNSATYPQRLSSRTNEGQELIRGWDSERELLRSTCSTSANQSPTSRHGVISDLLVGDCWTCHSRGGVHLPGGLSPWLARWWGTRCRTTWETRQSAETLSAST